MPAGRGGKPSAENPLIPLQRKGEAPTNEGAERVKRYQLIHIPRPGKKEKEGAGQMGRF